MSFTKLDSGIVNSSIWSEPTATRVLWITMLAMSDDTGFVATSAPGLIRAANITKEDFSIGIKALESEDEFSRTSEYGGRRVDRVEGGWIILNYMKYREREDKDKHREYMRDYRKRACDSQNLTVIHSDSQNLTVESHSASASVSASGSASESGIKASNVLYDPKVTTAQTEEIYGLYPRKIGRGAALKKIAAAIKDFGFEPLRAKVIEYATSVRGKEQQFIPHPATWFGQQRYKDEIEIVTTGASPPRATYGRQEVTKESIQAILEMELPD
jgi:hypothetical protein